MDYKKMSWKFTDDGELKCELENYTFIITEHMKDEYHMCGYDIRAYCKGNSEPIYADFMSSFIEANESLDVVLFLAERNSVNYPMAL